MPGHLAVERVHQARQEEQEATQPDPPGAEGQRRGQHDDRADGGQGVRPDTRTEQPADQRLLGGVVRTLDSGRHELHVLSVSWPGTGRRRRGAGAGQRITVRRRRGKAQPGRRKS